MKKYILLLVAVLIIASALMADKIEITKNYTTENISLKIDGKIVITSKNFTDIENYLKNLSNERIGSGVNGDWNNYQYDGYDVSYDQYGHVISKTVHCHWPSPVNDCAAHASHIL